jgi:hypothetical protein
MFSGDVMYRIIHETIPVHILMFIYNISKTHKCVVCKEAVQKLSTFSVLIEIKKLYII